MNKTIKILGIVLLAVLAVTAVGAGVAYAQTSTPTTGFGPGWMMGGSGQTGYGHGMMGGRGGMLGANSDMHTFVWNALAETLGLTSDELTAEVSSGKTIVQIAEEKGISRTDLVAALETAHNDALAQAVADGYLTQEQADSMLAQMAGRYEWMIDNTGAGYGMMGRYGQQSGGGQFTPGGCHGNWAGSTTAPQSNP